MGKVLKIDEVLESEDMKVFRNMVEISRADFKRQNYIQPFVSTVEMSYLGKGFKFTNLVAAQTALSDGRVSSAWEEFIAEAIYNLALNPDKNGVYDLYLDFDLPFNNFKQRMRIGVKSLTKGGLDLTQSKWKGRGIKLNAQQEMTAFISSVMLCEYHIAVDIIESGTYYFLPISSMEILMKVIDGIIRKPKLNKKEFYEIFYNKTLEDMIKDGDFIEHSVD